VGCGWFVQGGAPLPPLSQRMRGMTEAGYAPTVLSSPEVLGQLPVLKKDGVDWIAVQAAWYQVSDSSTRIFPDSKLTPTDASVSRLIAAAHHAGFRVFLNPFVNSLQGDGWQARFHPTSVKAWFRSFDAYLAHYAWLAQQDHADLLAIGDEFQSLDAVPAYRSDWIHAILVARRYYKGPITYGANYPDYQQVTFWSALDDVGLDAYFPLSTIADPTVGALRRAWNREADSIETWRRRADLSHKPFIICELGYPSEDMADAEPGAWYPHRAVNLALQQKLYLAAFETVYRRPWMRGIFWFWWANPSNPHWQGGPDDNGYTLKGKPALNILREFFTGRGPGLVRKRTHAVGRAGPVGA